MKLLKDIKIDVKISDNNLHTELNGKYVRMFTRLFLDNLKDVVDCNIYSF